MFSETYSNHEGMVHLPFAGNALCMQCNHACSSLVQAQPYASFSFAQAQDIFCLQIGINLSLNFPSSPAHAKKTMKRCAWRMLTSTLTDQATYNTLTDLFELL